MNEAADYCGREMGEADEGECECPRCACDHGVQRGQKCGACAERCDLGGAA